MKLLVIEDDPDILSFLRNGFEELGYTFDSAMDGEEGEYLIELNSYDMIVLDWMLPKKSGIELLKSIRQKDIKTPAIMLTAKGDIDDKVKGLLQGADDYLSKPFSFKELNARIIALYRRSLSFPSNIIKLNDEISLDIDVKSLKKDNKEIILAKKEFELLSFLVKHKNSIVSNDMIEEQLWNNESYINSNVIQVTVYNLRKKTGKELIKSFRGLGYKLEV